jgi:uncharacterized membrane protein
MFRYGYKLVICMLLIYLYLIKMQRKIDWLSFILGWIIGTFIEPKILFGMIAVIMVYVIHSNQTIRFKSTLTKWGILI